jgi:hypothetical protein
MIVGLILVGQSCGGFITQQLNPKAGSWRNGIVSRETLENW